MEELSELTTTSAASHKPQEMEPKDIKDVNRGLEITVGKNMAFRNIMAVPRVVRTIERHGNEGKLPSKKR